MKFSNLLFIVFIFTIAILDNGNADRPEHIRKGAVCVSSPGSTDKPIAASLVKNFDDNESVLIVYGVGPVKVKFVRERDGRVGWISGRYTVWEGGRQKTKWSEPYLNYVGDDFWQIHPGNNRNFPAICWAY